MVEQIVFREFEEGELVVHDDGSATYNGHRYTRKRTAYLRRSKDVCDHTKEEWMDLVKKYNYRCCNCDSEVIGGIPTKDHIIPHVIGGSTAINNIQPLCRECNTSKGQRTIDYRI